MQLMSLEFRLATSVDMEDLLVTQEEARRFKVSQGDLGWGRTAFSLEDVEDMVSQKAAYIVTDGKTPVASFELHDSDPDIWGPDKGNDGKALYLHSLAVADAFRGSGVGRQCIEWACQKVIGSHRLNLRLDCGPANTKLRQYYERQAFWYVGDSPLEGYPGALYERRV